MGIAKQLAIELDRPKAEIKSRLLLAPLHYKVYKIPKRDYGVRTIAQPTPDLKQLQRAFLHLYPLPVHQAAMAYCLGLSIKDNAQQHRKNSYLLKMDLNRFFNSITPTIFWKEWGHVFKQPNAHEKKLIQRLLFWSPSKKLIGPFMLSIGAPSSPCVSNFVMFRFDEKLTLLCQKKGIVYTRYADDLTFSTRQKGALAEMPDLIAELLADLFGVALTVNRRKTVFSSKAHNRHVTGITITNDAQLSLGRKRKRYIKHLVHQFIFKQLLHDDIGHLRGLLSFAAHIEPTFIVALEKKYGIDVLNEIHEVSYD